MEEGKLTNTSFLRDKGIQTGCWALDMLTAYKCNSSTFASPLAPKFCLESYYANILHSSHEYLSAENVYDGVALHDTKAKQLSAWLLGDIAQLGKCL